MKRWANELKRAFQRKKSKWLKKHMEKCSPSLAIKEMQIKTTLRFHLTPVRIATINNKCWQGWVECKLVQPLWKTIGRLLKKLNIDLPYDLAIPLLGIYPKECDSSYSRGTHTPMFIAALFTIAKLWKQPRCSTTNEWIKKMWYLYTMEFYSAIKKNEILSFPGKWMELENIILSKVSRVQKAKSCMLSLICRLQTQNKCSNIMGHRSTLRGGCAQEG
jgi:hypothetical protein